MTPAWVFDLDAVLTECETCQPEARQYVYPNAYDKLSKSKTIPEHVRKAWMEKIKYGIVWDLPRRMK